MTMRNGHQGPTMTRGSPRTHHDDPTTTPHPGGPSTTHATHHPPPAPEQLLVGWMTGGTTTRCLPPHLQAAARRVVCGCVPCRGAKTSMANTGTRPHCCERLLTGWFGCYWPHHPTSPNGYDGQHTTHPSLTSHCSWGGLWVEQRCTQPPALNNAPPTPSLMSHCSWGGDWRPPLPIATAPTTTATSHCSWGGRGAMREVVCGRGCFPLESSGIAGFRGV
jgi:hypothetical protein